MFLLYVVRQSRLDAEVFLTNPLDALPPSLSPMRRVNLIVLDCQRVLHHQDRRRIYKMHRYFGYISLIFGGVNLFAMRKFS